MRPPRPHKLKPQKSSFCGPPVNVSMPFLGMSRSEGAANATEAPQGTRAPLALLAAFCVLLGILPTYVIPMIDRARAPLVPENATAALIPPFFMSDVQRRENIAPKFLTEFHDLGAQVGQSMLPAEIVISQPFWPAYLTGGVSEQYVDQLLNRTTMPGLTRCASSLASQFVMRTQPCEAFLSIFEGSGVPCRP